MLVDQSKPPWRIWSIFRPTKHPRIVVHERAGDVRDYWLFGMMSLVYPTKADTKISWWRLSGREIWDLIHQLPGTRRASRGGIIGYLDRYSGVVLIAAENGGV